MLGVGVSPGIAIGKAWVVKEENLSITQQSTRTPTEEIERLNDSLVSVRRQLEQIKERAVRELGDKAQILDAQILVTQDEELLGVVREHINAGKTAEAALESGVEFYAKILEGMDNEYMRERAADLRDVGGRIIRHLLGAKQQDLSNLTEDYIIVAEDLTPSDTAGMNKTHVLGFVTDIGGRTSHTAIMARSLEIPAIVGTKEGTSRIKSGDLLILDVAEGEIIIQPDSAQVAMYEKQRTRIEAEKQRLQKLITEPSLSLDGHKVELAANIGTPKDCTGALNNGAEGIGLFRTEFLYLNRDRLPTEEEQFEAYKSVLATMAPRPVVIRTLDVGGDKEISYLNLPKESNPFLGYRAIRVCLRQTDIFRTQLRALLRASTFGNLKIMFPMISSLDEVRQTKRILEEVRAELKQEGASVSSEIEVGIMIEIPAAAMISDVLAQEVDFFSIGTNDLIQYTTAVDRMNEGIAHLYTPFHPAVLRLIQTVIENGHKSGIWVGMCGEAAGDPALIPLFLGMGLDEFSMSAISVLPARELISRLNREELKKKVPEILQAGTAQEVKEKMGALGY
ncbi:phosphoenolpyruvate-protein phosphotransferase [Acididesulfobacillus acetoxydans]|uniref:Phosphoenolpyruvate-protein phosphotransferase n=1 Tax=Acididesulfobacillus acetoxydans TaxID=1561005 RepID=A0A8S0XV93_9FIRM|nr:phosphoenolpyruvate--protein phosphotransferase [Acididesulfobacillus acetoxydans]CAA7600107.1 phosphoenolpyruvate-protein phosphotransferase [Acididesulfobacillus acetoxydans]CEJ07649.1 Phosphoenolpyruvate-protein phosphotransferase [Acididesulfobacillus acetoxydans]